MKKVLIALFLILGFISANSQDFSRGWLALNNSDTLIGYLRKTVENDLSVLYFKMDNKSKYTRYFPFDVVGFSIDGEVYESHTVIVDKDTISDFFSCKIKGKVSLYSRYDISLKEHLYLRIENGPLKELIIKKVIVDNPEGSGSGYAEKTYYNYYRVLAEAYADCPELVSGKEMIRLNLKGIEKSVVDYHKCVKKTYKVYEPLQTHKKKGTIDYGISFGLLFLSEKFTLDKYHYSGWSGKMPFSKFTNGFNLTGISQYYFPNSNQTKAVQTELSFARYNFFTYSTFDYNYKSGDKILYSKDYLHFRIMYKNFFWINNSGLFLGLGVQLNIPLSSIYDYVKVRNVIFGDVGYAYNIKKYKIFAEVRYSGIMTTNLGVLMRFKE